MVRYTLVNPKTISRKVTDKLVRAVDFGEGKWALTRKGEEWLDTLYPFGPFEECSIHMFYLLQKLN